MRSLFATLLLLLPGLLLSLPAPAQETPPALEEFARGLDSYRAEFTQRVTGPDRRILEESSGTMALRSPDLFRWHYREPFEQLIVADGSTVWIHDVELEQVTTKEQGGATRNSPLYVLTEPESLGDRFDFEDRGQANGVTRIGLVPKADEAEFEWVELALEGRLLQSITIRDSFGQTTHIAFRRPERNPEIPAEAFCFEPPEGVDVIGEAELGLGADDFD